MEKYIGSKIVQAEPAIRYLMKGGDNLVVAKSDQLAMQQVDMNEVVGYEEAYSVVYEGGYESWSPKNVFEAAYRQTDGMSFGLAIEAAKKGFRIARQGWNGKGMYVFLVHGMDFCTNADLSELDDQDVEVLDCLVMRTATGAFCPGWLASQSDMLADDWYIVEG